MTQTTVSFGWRVLGVEFCWLESILRHIVDTMTLKLSLLTSSTDSSWLQLLTRKRLLLSVHVPSFILSTVQQRSADWQRHLEPVTISAFSVFVGHAHHHEARQEGSSFWAIMHNLLCLMYLLKVIFLLHAGRLFPSSSEPPINWWWKNSSGRQNSVRFAIY